MDINQSPFSHFKQNKAFNNKSSSVSTSKHVLKNTITEQATNTQNKTDPMLLKAGQLVKGEILDIRYHEVSIRIEPGSQVVTAKLEGDLPLSIGQKAQFIVTEESFAHISLKYIPPEMKQATDITIEKALEASGLSKTLRNKEIVEALLNHRMPIDKNTLHTLVRLCTMNRSVSPQTVVLMKKHDIPLTPENMEQFEAYEKGEHQIVKAIDNLFTHLDRTLQAKDAPSQILASDIHLHIIEMIIKSNDVDINDIPVKTMLTGEEMNQLKVFLHSLSLNSYSEELNQLEKGTLPLHKVVEIIKSQYNNVEVSAEMRNNPSINISMLDLSEAPTTEHLVSKLNSLYQHQEYTPKLSSMLTSTEREALFYALEHLPELESYQEPIINGSVNIKNLFFILQSAFQLQSKSDIGFLQSPEYRKLLTEALHQRWVLTPDRLSNKQSVTDLYRSLRDDIEKLNNIMKASGNASETSAFHEPVKALTKNLQFMKELNEVFQYIQLPVQFADQDIHTELFVLAKKKDMKDNRDNLSVLLQLEMKNLGSIAVMIKMNHNRINTVFYPQDTAVAGLISEHISMLRKALSEKGYELYAKVENNYQKPDFIKDLIEHESADSNIQRYTFDIRT